MNDFTKEDLKIIVQSLNVSIREGSQYYATERINLRLKIQSIIDNYCEHEHLKDVGNEYMVCRACAKEIYE